MCSMPRQHCYACRSLTVCEGREVRVSHAISLFPGVCDLLGKHPDGPHQDHCSAQLANFQLQNAATAVPGLYQFLPLFRPELQLRGGTSHCPHRCEEVLVGSPEANGALQALKECFILAPIYQMPDPVVVEVDASDVGVVLLQKAIADQKLHTCAFFS